jgi:hypothetical protein
VTRLRPAVDVQPAEWVVLGLRGFAESVLSLVPVGFSAYVRVFHPAYRQATKDGRPVVVPVSWSEIAAVNAKDAHPGMQLGALTDSYDSSHPSQPGLFDHAPDVGSLPDELVAPLATLLANHTTTPDRCWFAVWSGFGGLASEVRQAPEFSAPHREYHLLSGPVDALLVEPLRDQSPNLWWPDDRAWCAATEIDLDSTYIGCDDACRDQLLALPKVEAAAIDPATGIDFASDLRNPLRRPATGGNSRDIPAHWP